MRKLSTLLHIIDTTSEWSGKIVSFVIVLVIGTMVWFVLARYVLHIHGLFTYGTLSKLFFVYVIFGAAYALHVRVHVNVDIIHGRLPLRVRGIVDVFTFIAFFLFCLALLWMAVKTAVDDSVYVQLSLRSFLPQYWPITLMAPFGVFLFLLRGLSKFIRDLVIAITGKELA